MKEKISDLALVRQDLREVAAQFPESLKRYPQEQWWFVTYRNLERARKASEAYPEEVRDYLAAQIEYAKQLLRGEVGTKLVGEEAIEHRVDGIINELSRWMSVPFCEQQEDVVEGGTVKVEELVANHPEILKMSKGEDGRLTIHVQHPETKLTYSFMLPQDDQIFYKGGVARILLNVLAGAPRKMIESEIPWNDLDVIVVGDSGKTRDQAIEMGVDPEGVEMLGGELNLQEYYLGRDTDHNQVLLGRETLYYSNAAFEAARTGRIELTGLYMPNRALYGTDTFRYRELTLGTPRGLFRLIKSLAEGKAESFLHHPANRFVDVAPYYLFLARRWSSKENFPILLQRAIAIGRRIGQIPDDGKGSYEVLSEMHERYPLFDLSAKMEGLRKVVEWKAGKIIRQFDRETTWRFSIKGDMEIPDEVLDQEVEEIDLKSFEPDTMEAEKIRSGWERFCAECSVRTAEAGKKGMTPSERYFLKNDRWLRFQSS